MVCLKASPTQLCEDGTDMVWITHKPEDHGDTGCVTMYGFEYNPICRRCGVTFDSELTMRRHANTVTRACFHHIHRLKQIRRLLGKDVAAGLFSAFIPSRLDYCNAVLTVLPKSTIAPLQRVQNAASRLVARLGPRDHVTSTIRDLHWLHVQHRIT